MNIAVNWPFILSLLTTLGSLAVLVFKSGEWKKAVEASQTQNKQLHSDLTDLSNKVTEMEKQHALTDTRIIAYKERIDYNSDSISGLVSVVTSVEKDMAGMQTFLKTIADDISEMKSWLKPQ